MSDLHDAPQYQDSAVVIASFEDQQGNGVDCASQCASTMRLYSRPSALSYLPAVLQAVHEL